MNKLSRVAPYGGTTVPVEKTKVEIEVLLKSYGVKGIQWTSYENEESLKFLVEVGVKGVRKELVFELKPPSITVKKRVPGRGIVRTENRNQEYRLMFYYIKSKIEAVVWGLSTIEQEFLSQVMVNLPDKQVSLGTVLADLMAKDKLANLALPDKEPEKGSKPSTHDEVPVIIDIAPEGE